MSVRRIAVLVGSRDPAYFAGRTQSDRPSEAAVLTALRAQRSTSDSSHRASAIQTVADHGRSIARHAEASGAGPRRARVRDSGGPPRIGVFAAAARPRRPIRHARVRLPARVTAGA
jgi:hypothetical protein